MKKNLYLDATIFVLLAMALTWPVRAGEMTAFQLIKEGNRYVGEESKNQVVQIRSEKSVVGMVPNIWYVVYYDPDATFHATEVKFGAGKKMEVKRPMRMLEFGSTAEKRVDMKKLNVDSDKALSIALQDPLLKGLNMKASQFWLDHSDDGPVWRVRLWADSIRHPGDQVDIGEIYVLTDDGKVTKRDLHIERVN